MMTACFEKDPGQGDVEHVEGCETEIRNMHKRAR